MQPEFDGECNTSGVTRAVAYCRLQPTWVHRSTPLPVVFLFITSNTPPHNRHRVISLSVVTAVPSPSQDGPSKLSQFKIYQIRAKISYTYINLSSNICSLLLSRFVGYKRSILYVTLIYFIIFKMNDSLLNKLFSTLFFPWLDQFWRWHQSRWHWQKYVCIQINVDEGNWPYGSYNI